MRKEPATSWMQEIRELGYSVGQLLDDYKQVRPEDALAPPLELLRSRVDEARMQLIRQRQAIQQKQQSFRTEVNAGQDYFRLAFQNKVNREKKAMYLQWRVKLAKSKFAWINWDEWPRELYSKSRGLSDEWRLWLETVSNAVLLLNLEAKTNYFYATSLEQLQATLDGMAAARPQTRTPRSTTK